MQQRTRVPNVKVSDLKKAQKLATIRFQNWTFLLPVLPLTSLYTFIA